MKVTYQTAGTCSTQIELELEDGIVQEVLFKGGCDGNLQGVSRLVKGLKATEIIAKLEGIKCGRRATSCPDQLCRALRQLGY